MIGRAIQGNPWLFSRILHYQNTGELLPPPSMEEVKKTMLRHAKMQLEYRELIQECGKCGSMWHGIPQACLILHRYAGR